MLGELFVVKIDCWTYLSFADDEHELGYLVSLM